MKQIKIIIASICRTLLGIVFIFSGAVKAIDPLGTVYKIEDYLKAFGGIFTDLLPAAEIAAWSLIILELLLGVCMLLNVRTKWTMWISLLFYSVMTPLTLYIALTNPVSDCGCFGDAIVLTNWQTFGKNVILIILAITLVSLKKYLHPLWRGWMEIVIAATTVMAISSFMLWTIRHLPVIDFRPYQVGNHLPTIMEDFEPDEVEYLYICEKEGVQETFTAANYPDSTWKLVSWEQKIIKKGYESPIHDFEIINANGDDLTLDILESSSPVRLVVMYDLSKADKSQMTKIEALLEEELAAKTVESVICDSIGAEEMMSDTTEYIEEDYEEVIPLSSVYILTGSGTEDIESFSIDYPHLAEYICTCDPVTLKTIVRANPGVIVLQNGIVIDKYNVRNR
jgi:uncharacterized membrane protein YphA (DoxX/SURF4 family)